MPDYESFREAGFYKSPDLKEDRIFLSDFFEDPDKNPLKTPSGKIEIFSDTIDSFNYNDCPGHPTWMEPDEWLGTEEKTYPLHLISNQPKTKLHSQMDNGTLSSSIKIKGHQPLEMNPDDAQSRGITQGDIVRVFNGRGSCLCGANITADVMPGVVIISTGSWYDPAEPNDPKSMCKHGNPNVLSPDIGTSKLGQGPAAHSCLAEIEIYDGPTQDITAFNPPEIIEKK